MIKHEILVLEEQKYVGIKTKILFEEHDNIDFCQLQKEVLEAVVDDIDNDEYFMALDTDFTKKSFSYVPLVPVKSFRNSSNFTQYIREQGTYYAFEVVQTDCNPSWFRKLNNYIKENNLSIERNGYDLELYKKDYVKRINKMDFNFEEEVYMILLKKKEN